uniref:Uncharacterized protein n=1 Tax=Rhizophora mucronata TaxID=61149 RepID=A0A2P2N745_RHIMU
MQHLIKQKMVTVATIISQADKPMVRLQNSSFLVSNPN